MQGLVDYGSDSDDDTPARTPAPAPAPTSTSTLAPPTKPTGLNLPPPATAKQVTITASAPPTRKQKDRGPVRILLDLPPPSSTSSSASTSAEDDQPAKKRQKLALGGASSGAGLTGLAALLPKPKNDAPKPIAARPVKPRAGLAGLDELFDEQGDKPKVAVGGPMFLPPSVAAKGKGKAAVKPAPAPQPEAPAVDFFGLGSVTSAPSPSSASKSSSSKPTVSSAPSFSAAPSVSSAPTPRSAAPAEPAQRAWKQPTADDPYPGFTQLPSSEWVAKDQQAYEALVAWQAQQAAQPATCGEDIPRGFGEKDVAGQGGYVDVDEAQRAKDAWATRPSQVPGREQEYKKGSEVKGISKQIGGNAKRKHQLSSLLAAAHDNRAELEDRIAQARSNRKSAGNKYGF
ncbi:hypothetical protein JCM11641_005968 [Rhodosporidiobolus odoratus]